MHGTFMGKNKITSTLVNYSACKINQESTEVNRLPTIKDSNMSSMQC